MFITLKRSNTTKFDREIFFCVKVHLLEKQGSCYCYIINQENKNKVPDLRMQKFQLDLHRQSFVCLSRFSKQVCCLWPRTGKKLSIFVSGHKWSSFEGKFEEVIISQPFAGCDIRYPKVKGKTYIHIY